MASACVIPPPKFSDLGVVLLIRGFGKYLSKKLFWYLLTFAIALLLNFFLPRLIPGNPVDVIVSNLIAGQETARATQIKAEFSAQLGLDKPMIQQFFTYVANLFKGDLGRSFNQYPRTVTELLSACVPFTLGIQLPAILAGWLFGNLLGAKAAYKKGLFDKTVFPVSLFLSSIPAFIFSLVILYTFGVTLKWLPIGGAYAPGLLPSLSFRFFFSLVQHWFLPFLSLTVITIGGQAIGMRSMSLYELNADYVLYAKLLGIPDKKVTKYVFRNAVLPQITGLALSLGTMIGGALITEIVFNYPGVGQKLMLAIRNVDYPLISGCTLIISMTVLIANFLIEIVYGFIDPRVRAAQQEEG